MGIYLLFSFVAALIMSWLQFLGFHATIHSLEQSKKLSLRRQFIFFVILGNLVVFGQFLLFYMNYRHEQAAASILSHKRMEEDTNTSQKLEQIETLLATRCFGSAAQQCATKIHKLRQEIQDSGSQTKALDPSIKPFLGGTWAFKPSLSNPFGNLNPTDTPPVNNQTQLSVSSQKHFSVPLVESLSLSEQVAATPAISRAHIGVDQYGMTGGDCLTEECNVIIASADN